MCNPFCGTCFFLAFKGFSQWESSLYLDYEKSADYKEYLTWI